MGELPQNVLEYRQNPGGALRRKSDYLHIDYCFYPVVKFYIYALADEIRHTILAYTFDGFNPSTLMN